MTQRNQDGDTFKMRGGFVRGEDGRLYHVDMPHIKVHPILDESGRITHYEGKYSATRFCDAPLVRTGQGTSQVDYPTEPVAGETVTSLAAWAWTLAVFAAGVFVGGFLVWRLVGGGA